jgi:hypothetical protein
MKKYYFTFSMLDENKSLLGIDYMKGYVTNEDGQKERFHEIYVGFIFFFISFYFSKK